MMASARVAIAAALNPGFFRRVRAAKRRSLISVSSMGPSWRQGSDIAVKPNSVARALPAIRKTDRMIWKRNRACKSSRYECRVNRAPANRELKIGALAHNGRIFAAHLEQPAGCRLMHLASALDRAGE